MKKQLLALVCVLPLATIQSYNFYILNDGDIPITGALKVKGVMWPWDKTFIIQPKEYAEFNTLAYCGKSFEIGDARTNLTGDQIVPNQSIEIPWNTACHQFQKLLVKTPLADPGQKEMYYDIYGKQHGNFSTTYEAALSEQDKASWLTSYTKSGTDLKNQS